MDGEDLATILNMKKQNSALLEMNNQYDEMIDSSDIKSVSRGEGILEGNKSTIFRRSVKL